MPSILELETRVALATILSESPSTGFGLASPWALIRVISWTWCVNPLMAAVLRIFYCDEFQLTDDVRGTSSESGAQSPDESCREIEFYDPDLARLRINLQNGRSFGSGGME